MILSACAELPKEQISTQALISDAVHGGGKQGFYFLPPLVEPTPLPAPFDGTRSLTAELVDPYGTVLFSTPLTVDLDAQHYRSHIDIGGLVLDRSTPYRVRVMMASQELGFADILVFGSQKEAKSLASDDVIELVDGKKMPLKVYLSDVTPPVISFTSIVNTPEPDVWPSTNGCTTATGLAVTDHEGVINFTVTDDNPVAVTCSLVRVSNDPAVSTPSTLPAPGACSDAFAFTGLSSGEYHLVVTADDGTNTSSHEQSWLVDANAPIIVFSDPRTTIPVLPEVDTYTTFIMDMDASIYQQWDSWRFLLTAIIDPQTAPIPTSIELHPVESGFLLGFLVDIPENIVEGAHTIFLAARDCVGNQNWISHAIVIER